jgi:hypothetical protein
MLYFQLKKIIEDEDADDSPNGKDASDGNVFLRFPIIFFL